MADGGSGGHFSLTQISEEAINQGRLTAKNGCQVPAGKVLTQFKQHTQSSNCCIVFLVLLCLFMIHI